MNVVSCKTSLVLLAAALLCACGGDTTPGTEPASSAAPEPVATVNNSNTAMPTGEACVNSAESGYLCGVTNGEDILRIGTTDWLLVSGMDGSLTGGDNNGRLHLVNARNRSVEILFPGNNPALQHDNVAFAACPGPMNTGEFSAHGLALQKIDKGPDTYHLYMTSHGAREAIEVFEVDAFIKPTIKWIGCIPMPSTSWTNSVTILNDGGFMATQFFDPAQHTIANVMAGEITGHVFEWHPGGEVSVIPGTDVSGANGIALSDDERWIYVASFGTGEVIRFDRSSAPPGRESVAVGIAPDNIRWTEEGTLLTAGNNTEANSPGWSVVEIVPYSLAMETIVSAGEDNALHDASTALRLGEELWIGTFSGDRLAILPIP